MFRCLRMLTRPHQLPPAPAPSDRHPHPLLARANARRAPRLRTVARTEEGSPPASGVASGSPSARPATIEARRLAEHAVETRRRGQKWLVRTSLTASILFLPFLLLAMGWDPRRLTDPSILELLYHGALCGMLGLAVGGSAVVGILVARREDAALADLHAAAAQLSAGEIAQLASEIEQQSGDASREATAVLRQAAQERRELAAAPVAEVQAPLRRQGEHG